MPEGPLKPYYIKAKKISGGTYVRIGSSTRLANIDLIKELQREKSRITFDETSIHQKIAILDRDLLQNYFGARATSRRLLSEKIICSKAMDHNQYEITVAGGLMFCDRPDNYIDEALIRLTLFKGTSGRNIIKTEEIIGPIDQQGNTALEMIKSWLAIRYELKGANLEKVFPIPEIALREAIINALLHRKYSIKGAIKIAIWDDRIEIFSPGDFPGMVDLNNLGDGTSYLRNPVLVRLAHRIGLVEMLGTGIRIIYESCREANLKAPEFFEEGDYVKVVFYFEIDPLNYANEQDALSDFIASRQSVTAQQVAEFLHVSRNTAIRKLNELIDKKHIKKVGKGVSVRYRSVAL